jgi:hypothetical protein
MLVALEKTEKRYSGSVVWKCRCDCGNICEVAQMVLPREDKISCGCFRKESYIEGTWVLAIDGSMKMKNNNKTGATGVFKNKKDKYVASITFKGKRYNLGTFLKLEDAAKVRRLAEDKIYGEFLEWYHGTYPVKKKS